MKTCTKCGEERGLEEFGRRKASRDGLDHRCKACRAAYYQANKKRMDANSKRWAKENPKRWREIHRRGQRKAQARGYFKAWRKANPEKWREYGRRNDKPAKQSERRARRRALMRNAYIAEVDLDEVIRRYCGHCGICGEPVLDDLHLDHIIPLAAGGTHEPNNVQLAHAPCNQRKGTRLPAT